MKLKNIVIVQDFAYINGGAAKVALTSAIELRKRGYRVIVFSGMPPVWDELTNAGVEVVCLDQADLIHSNKLTAFCRGLWNFKAAKQMEKLLRKLDNEETIVHLHGWNKVLSPSIWNPIRKLKFKVAITQHEYYMYCPNLGLFNYRKLQLCHKQPSSLGCYLSNCDSRNYVYKLWRDVRQMIQRVELKMYGKVNFITIGRTNDSLAQRYFSKHISQRYIVKNPIELNLKDKVDVSNNDTYIAIGRLSREKGIDLFCQSMSDLNLKGCVLGDGYMMSEYKEKYPNVTFAGWVQGEEMEGYLRKAKALVFPSLWYEGAPLTTVEIKSYGIPAIVPDKCAASETTIDGKDGFIFEIGNLESLKQAIMKMENADVKQMQDNLFKNFNPSEYAMETHIDNLVNVYNQIMN